MCIYDNKKEYTLSSFLSPLVFCETEYSLLHATCEYVYSCGSIWQSWAFVPGSISIDFNLLAKQRIQALFDS